MILRFIRLSVCALRVVWRDLCCLLCSKGVSPCCEGGVSSVDSCEVVCECVPGLLGCGAPWS